MSSFAQDRVVKSLTSQSFGFCQKLSRIESESALYAAIDDILADICRDCEIDAAAFLVRKPHQPNLKDFLKELHTHGMNKDERKKIVDLLQNSLFPEISERLKAIKRDNIRVDILSNQASGPRSKLVSMIAVPVIVRHELVGLFLAFRLEIAAFCDADGDFFQEMASSVAEDIENSGSFLRIAKDATTGLYSRRIFFESLAQETARARRYQAPLSVIILEVEASLPSSNAMHFLKRFSQRVSAESRQSDIVSRISENAFIFLQPMTPAQGAVEFVQRLLENLRANPIMLNESMVPLLLSAGISTLRLDDEDSGAMLRRADSALEMARKNAQDGIAIVTDKSID